MRYRQARICAHLIVIEQNIDIQRSRTFGNLRLVAKSLLHRLRPLLQLFRRQIRFDLDYVIQKLRLRKQIHRRRGIQFGGATHTHFAAGRKIVKSAADILIAVAQIRSQ